MAEAERLLHIVTELLAIPFGIFLIWLGSTLRVKRWVKLSLIVGGVGNLVIDGYLLFTWLR